MILQVLGIEFQYPGRLVLENINFSVEPGELLAVLGTNGTGKTTLLKCINRIIEPAKGTVLIGDDPVLDLKRTELAQRIGYVEQQKVRIHDTVFNTVLLGRKPYVKWDITQQDMEIASRALDTLGLSNYALRYLDELSGGELQKVILARALAQEPDLLLLDEPTSSLDLKNQLEVMNMIHKIIKERSIAAVVAMHDLNLALRFADRFLLLKNNRIFAGGGPEVVTPENIESVYSVPVAIAAYNGSQVIIPV